MDVPVFIDGIFALLGFESATLRSANGCHLAFRRSDHLEFPLESDLFPLAHDGICFRRNPIAVDYDFDYGSQDASGIHYSGLATVAILVMGRLCYCAFRKPVVVE